MSRGVAVCLQPSHLGIRLDAVSALVKIRLALPCRDDEELDEGRRSPSSVRERSELATGSETAQT